MTDATSNAEAAGLTATSDPPLVRITGLRKSFDADEPTAALGVRETAAVEALIRRLRDSAVTVLLISHDMAQVLRVADTAYVLRRGQTVARRVVKDTTGDELVGLITGAIEGDTHAGA